MVALRPCGRSWFSLSRPRFYLLFPAYFQSLKHFISLTRHVDDSGQFWGREDEECRVCVVGMLSRTFSKTNVRFDTNNCRGWKKIFYYEKLWWFAQLLHVGVTHCKVRRWKEQFTSEEMIFWQRGRPNGSTTGAHLACFWLYLISRIH